MIKEKGRTHILQIRERNETESSGLSIERVNGEIDPTISWGGAKGGGVALGNLEATPQLRLLHHRSLSLNPIPCCYGSLDTAVLPGDHFAESYCNSSTLGMGVKQLLREECEVPRREYEGA